MKLAASIVLAFCLASCVTSRAEPLGTVRFEARAADHPIIAYDTPEDVGRPFVKVGIVTASGRANAGGMVSDALKKQARLIGADAIVLRGEEGGDYSSVVMYTGSGPVFGGARRGKSMTALAIRFVEEKAD